MATDKGNGQESPQAGIRPQLCLLAWLFALPAPDKKEDKGKVIAIVGGDVYTITREVIRSGTVLVKDGKILRVGQDLPIPDGATILDAKGKYVTPGFVALSMAGVGLRSAAPGRGGPATPGGSRTANWLTPSIRSIGNMKFCMGTGITTGCVEISGGLGRRFGRDEANETQVCPCCGLAILPTEPITPPTPTLGRRPFASRSEDELRQPGCHVD